MDDEVRSALKGAVMKCLPILQPLTSQYTEPHLIWERTEDGWRMRYEDQPDLTRVLLQEYAFLQAANLEFVEVLKKHYPQYGGLVGTAGLRMSIISQFAPILGSFIRELWRRNRTLEADEAAIGALIREFEEFIELPTIRFRYMARLLNYHMEPDSLELVDNIVIRRLNDHEMTEIAGGPIRNVMFTPDQGPVIHDYILEGEFEEAKVLTEEALVASLGDTDHAQTLDRAILALRTFKQGQVGYNWLRIKPVKYIPLAHNLIRGRTDYTPIGTYQITEQEIEPLRKHAALIFSRLDPAMELACSRLGEAQTRTNLRDQLLDAIVGLEAILLAGLANQDRRSELKFRFALHYSTLFSTPEERYRAFRQAKDLYDFRSTIAHGGELRESNRLGDKKVSLNEAAQQACDSLREVIKRFLPERSSETYKNPKFWERSYFGLSPDA